MGKPPRLLNIGLSAVDVRDLAAAHVAALAAPDAPGERFLVHRPFSVDARDRTAAA